MTPFSKEFGQVDRLRGLQVSWRNIPITLNDSGQNVQTPVIKTYGVLAPFTTVREI
jgi:hypothetical protein